jgi:hypothetical protein
MTYRTPGVYPEQLVVSARPAVATGVPAFLAYATPAGESSRLEPLQARVELDAKFAPSPSAGTTTSHLWSAVDGFFANGGTRCFVVALDDRLPPPTALADGLDRLELVTDVDLLCVPDAVRRLIGHAPLPLPAEEADAMIALQRMVLDHCTGRADRFAILDSLPRAGVEDVLAQRGALIGRHGALYYPWVRARLNGDDALAFVPPSGHVAGVFARTDAAVGVHKAPANETLEGVLDLAADVGQEEQARLNPVGVNCIRTFRGRGIRVWGARTLASEPAWAYVSVVRVFLTAARWIEQSLQHLAFESNDASLWEYVEREVGAYFLTLYGRGALRGATARDAFYVKCNAETNPPEVRDAGQIVTEIGLAASGPNEFVVVQIVQHAEGVTIAGPTRPG